MGNRRNANRKRNRSKLCNKTVDESKNMDKTITNDEESSVVNNVVKDSENVALNSDKQVEGYDKDMNKTITNDEESSVVNNVVKDGENAVKNGEKQVVDHDKSVVEVSKTIATSTSPVKNTKTEIIYGDEEKGGEQTLTQIKNNTLINTEYTQNTTNFGITSCPKCPDEIPGGRMIMCDECHEWFHFICLGMDEGEEVEEYNCNVCLEELHTKMIQMVTPIPKMGGRKKLL